MIYAHYDSQMSQSGRQIRPGRGRKSAILCHRRPQIGPDRPKGPKMAKNRDFGGSLVGIKLTPGGYILVVYGQPTQRVNGTKLRSRLKMRGVVGHMHSLHGKGTVAPHAP